MDIMAKGSFEHLYPRDVVVLMGEWEKRKGVGTVFVFRCYREEEHAYRVAKWCKIALGMNDDAITKALVSKQGIDRIWNQLEERDRFFSLLRAFEAATVGFESLAKIERSFQWTISDLLARPYQLLGITSLSIERFQQVLSSCDVGQGDDTKGRHYLEQLLLQAEGRGHFYIPTANVAEAFRSKNRQFKPSYLGGDIIEVGRRIYFKRLYEMEEAIAQGLVGRIHASPANGGEEKVAKWEKENGVTLAKNQREAVLMSLAERLCVVTGGPGVGKTTVCKCITDILGEEADILMVAPTGRAAKRAKESTGLPASTCHKCLEYNGVRFNRNRDNPLETDVLVIDESSMIDAPLLLALLDALPVTTKLIFVGDVDQLPSVGPGEILRDIIESGVVPVTRLTEVFRQAADSPIITCAYAVNEGKLPPLASSSHLQYHMGGNDQEVADQTVMIASELYRTHDLFSVQILAPMYAGEAGIDALNRRIQEEVNPEGRSVAVGAEVLREGDKVLVTKNDKEKDVSNGDVGRIVSIGDDRLDIQFQGEDRTVTFHQEEWGMLQLSYAVTVHRAQGSEYPFCIIPLAKGYRQMLQKNLLYTAITRAKTNLWIVYEEEALTQSVKLTSVPKRNTSIKWLLQDHRQKRA